MELKETVVEQQVKISKFERQVFSSLSRPPEIATPTEPADARKLDKPGPRTTASELVEFSKAQECAEQEAREANERAEKAAREKIYKAEWEVAKEAEREAKERAEEAVRVKAEKNAKRRAKKEAKEQAERDAKEKVEQEAKERTEREKERLEREGVEREEKEKAEREKEREEKKKVPVSKIPSAWGSIFEKSDRSRNTSALSQKERKNEWAGAWDFGSTEKEPSVLPPIFTSSAPGGNFDGAGNSGFLAAGEKGSPGGTEEVKLHPPLTKGKNVDGPFNSNISTPEPAVAGGLDILEDLSMNNMSARISISSENERFTDAEQGPSPTEPTHPALVPAKTEPEKPLSLWDRKKLKTATPPAPVSNLFGGGEAMNPPGIWGDTSGRGGNTESIAMPTLVGNRQSVFTDTAHDQKRENQREGVIEGFLGSNSARRRTDSAQSGMTTKPAQKPDPAPASATQKSGGWGSWGSPLLNNIANTVPADRTPSLEPPAVRPKIEDPPRGFTPSQPPKSQPAGLGSLNKPAWGPTPRPGDNSAWGAAKTGPTPIMQKPSTGPAWGAKPAGSAFGSGMGKNLTVDTAKKPPGISPNTAGPENIPESAVEIKHLPAPGSFNSSIADKEAGDVQPDAWGCSEATGGQGL